MNCNDLNADQFVEFELTSTPELDEDFSTLYSSLENLVCSGEKKATRTVTVTSEYIPSSIESSFELALEHSTDFGDAKNGDDLEKALSEFIKFETNLQTSLLEIEKTCTGNHRHNTPMSFTRDSVAYRVATAVTPSSACGSPQSESQNAPLSSDEYECSLNRTGQDSLIGAMESLQIASSRKMRRKRKDLENFCGNSEITVIVTPSETTDGSVNSKEFSEDEKNALWIETSLSSKSDMENLSFSVDFADNRTTERSFVIGDEMSKTDSWYRLSETPEIGYKYRQDDKNVYSLNTCLRSKSDMENLSSSVGFSENRTTGGAFIVGEEFAETVPLYGISETSGISGTNAGNGDNVLPRETPVRSKSNLENLLFFANIAENQTNERTCIIGKDDNSEITITVPSRGISELSEMSEEKHSPPSTKTVLQSKSDIDNLLFLANIAENQSTGRTCSTVKENSSEIAKTSARCRISESSVLSYENCEKNLSTRITEMSLLSRAEIENVSSSSKITKNQMTEKISTIDEKDKSEIAETIPSYEIPKSSSFLDQKTEDNEIALLAEPEIENVPSSSIITKHKETEKTRTIDKENNSEIAKTISSYKIPESSKVCDKKIEEEFIALPVEPEINNAPSSSDVMKNQKTNKNHIIVKENNSQIAKKIDPSYEIVRPSSPVDDVQETASRIVRKNSNKMARDVADESSRSVHTDGIPADEKKKKRNNPRVLTSQVRRQSLKYRRSSGQFVSMAEAMLKFQKGTPKRFRSTVKKNQSRPAQPKIVKALLKATCPMSPNLRCKSRARPSMFPNREEREMLEIEQYRRNRSKEMKSPGSQKSTEKSTEQSSEKSAPSTKRASNLLSAGDEKKVPQNASARRKTLVKSVVSTEEGPMIENVEIFNFGVPIQRAKSPLTKQEPFSFDRKGKKMPGKRKTIHQRPAGVTSAVTSAVTPTVTSGSLEGAIRKPIELSFRERNELLLAKKKLIADRAVEKKQAWVFHAKQAPPVKQVLVRGFSTESLGAAKATQLVKGALRKGTSSENLRAAKVAPSVKQAIGRGTSMENLGAAKIAQLVRQVSEGGTSTKNVDPAKVVPLVKLVPEEGTLTENLDQTKVTSSVKLIPGGGTCTDNLELTEDKQKARGLSPAGRSRGLSSAGRSRGLSSAGRSRGLSPADHSRGLPAADRSRGLSPANPSRGLSPANPSRGLSPADRSRGLCPANRSRGLSPADRSRGLSPARGVRRLSPSIANRENRDPNVSPINNQCPKLKAPLKLHTADRSKKRQEYDAAIRRKELEAEEHRREYETYQHIREKEEEKELRKTMEPQARPVPVFRPPKIAKSLKPLTEPQSPAWSWKKLKK